MGLAGRTYTPFFTTFPVWSPNSIDCNLFGYALWGISERKALFSLLSNLRILCGEKESIRKTLWTDILVYPKELKAVVAVSESTSSDTLLLQRKQLKINVLKKTTAFP